MHRLALSLRAARPYVRFDIRNSGEGGATSRDIASPVEADRATKGVDYDRVFLGCGINDVWRRFQKLWGSINRFQLTNPRVHGLRSRSSGTLILACEAVRNQPAANPIVSQVDWFRWPSLDLRGRELPKGSVRSRGVEMHQVDDDGQTQVPLVDNQHAVDQITSGLRCPGARRVRGDPGEVHTARAVLDHDQRINATVKRPCQCAGSRPRVCPWPGGSGTVSRSGQIAVAPDRYHLPATSLRCQASSVAGLTAKTCAQR